MDISANLRAQQYADAQLGLTQAYLDPESPDEAAKRLQKARYLNVPVEVLDAVSPETVAQREVEAINVAELQLKAPQLSRRLSDTNFAKLVSDDITNTGWLEELVWKLAPDHGQKPTGLWGTLRNSGARGAYAIASNLPGFGSVDKLTRYSNELNAIRDKEAAIAAGKSDAELFGSDTDPTGARGRQLFEIDKQRQKDTLSQLILQEAETTAWANRLSSYFPQSEVMERFGKTKTLTEAVAVALGNPLEFLANVGPETMTQLAPAMPFMAMFGATMPGMAATFVSSSGFDRSAQIAEGLADMGVNVQDPLAVADAFMNPEKRFAIEQKIKEADAHAAATGLFDAASFGLAGKTLLPKKWASGLTERGKNFANTLVQAPVQGAMGAAGEAVGQIAAKGQVESWADVVAEFAGEFFTTPLEVLSAGIKATNWAQAREQKALQNAENAKQLAQAVVNSKLLQRDPETGLSLIRESAQQAGVETVYINPMALQQAGLAEQVRGMSETVNAKFDEALETGSDIAIPMEEFATKILPNDKDDAIVLMTGFGDTPSYNQAKEDAEAIQQEIAKEAKETLKANAQERQQSLAEVSRLIKQDLKAMPEVTPEEARSVRSVITVAVDTLARDMGISPMEAWNRYGARILGEPNIQRMPDGSIVVKTDAMKAEGQNQDSYGTYFPDLKIIARWAGANRTTLLHEASHMFLEMRLNAMRDLMAIEGELTSAQKRVVEIGQSILEWAGVKDFDAWQALSKDERTAIHEKWARSFEAYVMEGNEPSSRIKKAFRAFQKMLTEWYKVLAAIPGQSIDETTRELFDNLFLTNSQIQESYARQSALSLLTAEELGLTPEEYAEYQKAAEDMHDEALSEQMVRNAKIRTRVRQQYKKAEEDLKKKIDGMVLDIRNEIEDEMKETTSWKTWNIFKNGGKFGDEEHKPKLRKSDLVEMGYDDKAIETLRKAGLLLDQPKNQKFGLQFYVDTLGYASPVELVDDLLAHHDMEAQIDKKAVEQFANENPLYADGNKIREAIDTTWYNKARTTVLGLELRGLARQLGRQTKEEAKWFDSLAYTLIGKVPLKDLKPNKYMQDARRAAKNAEKAYVAGDLQACFNFKRQELYNTAMAKAAKEALIEQGKFKELARKFTGRKVPKGLEGDYLVLMQRILVKLGYGDEKKLGLNPTDVSLKDQVRALDLEYGIEIEIDDAFLEALNNRPGEVFSTVDGMRRVFDLVHQVNFQGRRLRHILVENAKADLQEKVEAINGALEDNAAKHGLEDLQAREEPGRKSKVASIISRIGFSHWRIPSLLAAMEGTRFGEFFKSLVEPMDRCGDKAEKMKATYAARLDRAFKPIMKSLSDSKKRTYKSVGVALTKMQVIALALNTGNEGNLARLIQLPNTIGVKELTEEQIVALMTEALTAKELQVVQEVWNVFEAMRQETGAVAKRINGREPLWVAPIARQIMSADGQIVELQGGYYPITYDREASPLGAEMEEMKNAEDLTKLYNMNHVFDSHIKSRMNVVDKKKGFQLTLTLRGAFEGLDRQIHYVAWAEWVNNAQRLVRAIKPTINKYWGSQAVKAIGKWIEDIRAGGRGNETQFDAFFNVLRSNVSLAGVGFNVVTAAVQFVGITQSVAVVGAKWVALGVREYISNRSATRDLVFSKSVMMQNRVRTQFRELAEVQSQVMGTTSPGYAKFLDLAYKPIVFMQTLVDIPTWVGAYNKALSEGHTDQMAIAIADRSVIDAQGSGRLQDLAGVERGKAAEKLFTVFYTFFNTALNIALVSKKTKKPLEWAADMSLILLVQPVMEATVRALIESFKNGEELDEDWLEERISSYPKEILDFGLGMFVGVREFQGLFDDYKNYTGPSGLRKIQDTRKALSELIDLAKGEEANLATAKALTNAISVWVGAPAAAINRVVEGGTALYEDETDNLATLFLGYNPN